MRDDPVDVRGLDTGASQYFVGRLHHLRDAEGRDDSERQLQVLLALRDHFLRDRLPRASGGYRDHEAVRATRSRGVRLHAVAVLRPIPYDDGAGAIAEDGLSAELLRV